MKCQKCGMYLPDDSEFCQYCGEKVFEQTVQSGLMCSNDEYVEQAESILQESPSGDSRTSHNDNIGVTGSGRFLVDGPDGLPIWITADHLGKKQPVSEEEVDKLKESLKSRLLPDYQIQDHTEKTAQDFENNTCSSCGQKLPNDSEFCQYCGKSLSDNKIREESTEVPIESTSGGDSVFKNNSQGSKSRASNHAISKQSLYGNEKHFRFCKECGGVIDSRSRKCNNCGKKYSHFKTVLVVLIPTLVFLALLGFNVHQYLYIQKCTAEIVALEQMLSEKDVEINTKNGDLSNLQSTISSLEESIAEKDTMIKTKDSKISTLQDQNSEYVLTNFLLKQENTNLQKDADFYNDICVALSSGNLGYAANNFRTSESVILVRKNEKNRKITLTANWSSGGTVSVTYAPNYITHAYISFDSNSWQTSTSLSIIPQSEGIQTVTFSNNVDTKTFKIVIIVTE